MARKGGYGKIDYMVSRDPTLSIESRAIYSILATYCDKKRECYPSIDQLLRDTGISKDRLYKHMKILEERGIVQKFYVKSDSSTFGRLTYRLCDFEK
ncbi:MAG: helix-turn-helix domain-containing protein [Lachnospiraceae bacterium]|nr:helix-turn-helix domain-containing protein [Lachnospiraceae bacterium]MCM1543101.1 helix-turn-helix domain-containing protein [Blautia sp.]